MDKFFNFFKKFLRKREQDHSHGQDLNGVPASVSALPFLKSKSFLYREEDLIALQDALIHDDDPAARVVVWGFNGIGKTELVMAFCYQHAADFTRIDWLQAAPAADYRDGIAVYEDLPAEEDAPVDPAGRLIVLEDVDDPDTLSHWLKKLPKVRMLITSTCADWPHETAVHLHGLGRFHRSESIQLLRQATPRLVKAKDAELDRLAECLCDLPLAITLVGRYLAARPRLSLNDTLSEIIGASAALNAPLAYWANESSLACADGVAALYTLLMHELSGKNARVMRDVVLAASACAPGRPIPVSLLRMAVGMEPAAFAPVLQRLFQLGLLTDTPQGPVIHHLLATFAHLDEPIRSETISQLAAAASEMGITANQIADPKESHNLCMHLRAIAEIAGQQKYEHAGALWNILGSYWWNLGELQAARICMERGLAIDQKILGDDHKDIAISLSNLGRVLYDLQDLKRARSLFARAMAINEKAYSHLYPGVAADAENLGMVLSDLGEYPEALTLLQKAQNIYENAYGYGPKNPAVSHTASSIGNILKEMGSLDEARRSYEKALSVDEWVYGPGNIRVSENLQEAAHLQRALGDQKTAQASFERLLSIQEAAYGKDHELVAHTLNYVGLCLQDNGILTRARDCFERALSIDEATYGPDHVNIARDANNLGSVMRDLGNLAEARTYFERALNISEQIYGVDHIHVGTNANNLARVLFSLGELEEARLKFQRVLAIDEKNYGPRSLEVATDLNNLGIIANDQRQFSDAQPLFQRALSIFSEKLPSEHAKILKARKYLERAKRKISTGSLTNKMD